MPSSPRDLVRPLLIGLAALLGTLGLASCSESDEAPDTADDESAQETSTPDTVETNDDQPAAGELPPAFSEVALTESVSLYLSVVDGEMLAVGVDLDTGIESYRVPMHPLGRLRGVTPHIAIDEASGQFFVTGVDLSAGDPIAQLGAYSIQTGQVEWRSESPADIEQPFLCAGDRVCVRSDAEQWWFSISDGSIEAVTDITNRRIVASTNDGFVASVGPAITPNDHLDFLTGSTDFGLTETWRIPGQAILDITGNPSTPMAGWGATHAESGTATALVIGSADGASTANVIGFDRSTGALLWGRNSVHDCAFGDSELDALLLCPPDDTDPGLTSQIVRLDPSTGDETWSISLDAPVDPSTFEIVLGAQNFYVWGLHDTVRVFELATGLEAATPDAVPCGVGGGAASVDWPWIDQAADYRAVRHVTLCDTAGRPLLTDELVTAWTTSDRSGQNQVAIDASATPVFVTTDR